MADGKRAATKRGAQGWATRLRAVFVDGKAPLAVRVAALDGLLAGRSSLMPRERAELSAWGRSLSRTHEHCDGRLALRLAALASDPARRGGEIRPRWSMREHWHSLTEPVMERLRWSKPRTAAVADRRAFRALRRSGGARPRRRR